jgi:hypothetical protein
VTRFAQPLPIPTRATEEAERIATRPPGIWNVVGAAIDREWMGSAIARRFGREGFGIDPRFRDDLFVRGADSPMWESLTDGLDPEFHTALLDAVSLDHAKVIRDQMLRAQRSERTLASAGASGVLARIGAAVLDPVAIAATLPTGGVIGLGTRATRMTRIARAGFIAGAENAAIEAIVRHDDPLSGIEDVVYAGLIGVALGAAGSEIGRAFSRSARDIEFENAARLAMGAAAPGEFRAADAFINRQLSPTEARKVVEKTLTREGSAYFREQLDPERLAHLRDRTVDMLGLDPEDAAELKALSPEDAFDRLNHPAFNEDYRAALRDQTTAREQNFQRDADKGDPRRIGEGFASDIDKAEQRLLDNRAKKGKSDFPSLDSPEVISSLKARAAKFVEEHGEVSFTVKGPHGDTIFVSASSKPDRRFQATLLSDGQPADDIGGKDYVTFLTNVQRGYAIDLDSANIIARAADVSPAPEQLSLTSKTETRGQGVRFHGSRAPIPLESPVNFSGGGPNFYGTGFYTTDALDIAQGYAAVGKTSRRTRKPFDSTIYQVVEKKTVKVLDLEQPAPPEIRDFIRSDPDLNEFFDEAAPLRELFDEIRFDVADHPARSANDAVEIMDRLTAHANERMGYDAIDHAGGLNTGSPRHGVRIYLKPEESIELRRLPDNAPRAPSDAATTPPPPPAPARFADDFHPEGANDSKATDTLIRRSYNSILGRSESSDIRAVTRMIVHDVLKFANDRGSSESGMMWKARQVRRTLTDYFHAKDKAFDAYRADRHGMLLDDVTIEQFNVELAVTRRLGGLGDGADPNVVKALKAVDDALRAVFQTGQRHGLFEGVEYSESYLPRLNSPSKFNGAIARFGLEDVERLYREAIELGSPDLDPAAAARIAKGFVRNVSRRDTDFNPWQKQAAFAGDDADFLEKILRDEGITDEAQIQSILYGAAKQPDAPSIAREKHRVRLDETHKIANDAGDQLSIMDFIENDIDRLVEGYTRDVLGASAGRTILRTMGQRFVDPESAEPAVFRTFDGLRSRLADGGATPEELELIHDLWRTLHNIPLESETRARKLMRQVRSINYLRIGGGFGLAQPPELAGAVGELGLKAFLQQSGALTRVLSRAADGTLTNPFLRDIEAWFAVGSEAIRERVGSIIIDEGEGVVQEGVSGLDRGLRRASKFASHASGLHAINAFMQTGSVAASIQRFINIAADGGTPKATDLATFGMARAEGERIADAIRTEIAAKRGIITTDGPLGRTVRRFRPDEFEDVQAAALLIQKIDQTADRLIMRGEDIGQLHPWMTRELGRTLFQFQRFHVRSWENHMLYSKQHALEGRTWARVSLASLTGGMIWMGQQYVRSLTMEPGERDEFRRETFTPQRFVAAGVQRGGSSSFLPQFADGFASIAGYDPPFDARSSGLSSRDIPFVSNNPTAQAFRDAIRATRGVASSIVGPGDEVFSDDDFRALGRLALPMNIIGVRNLVDLMAQQFPEED